VKEIVEYINHGPLIGGSCVLQSKRHKCVHEVSQSLSKSSLLGITWVHLDLVIPYMTLHEVVHLVSRSCIDQAVYGWQWELIFWARSIQVLKIYANPNLALAFISHEHDVGQPNRGSEWEQ